MTKYQVTRIGEPGSYEWAVIAIRVDGSRHPISKHPTDAKAREEHAWLSARALAEDSEH